MIERIVRMSFKPELVKDFIRVFEASKHQIAAFPGCNGLKLLQDAHDENVYFTYSLWSHLSDLEAYRHSELFKTTWAQTKILFNQKPIAWSTQVKDLVK